MTKGTDIKFESKIPSWVGCEKPGVTGKVWSIYLPEKRTLPSR